jgi:hypothetical protein
MCKESASNRKRNTGKNDLHKRVLLEREREFKRVQESSREFKRVQEREFKRVQERESVCV